MKQKIQRNKNKFDPFIHYANQAFEMMGIIVLGTFLGFKIDDWMGNEFRIFTLVFIVLSVIGALFYTIRKLLKK
ncbi:MAG: AtpZ/AtpI family protein [Mariniphaga sp.]|nr:AtpZ/AtpI family protein [Mariniphaga sp.]MDD4225101.1 AtpZ/AtpI family protein [Mariniphaga sp.]MDD4424443.1 AtpZ/AtpI family protein [Mariniphaga sp.]